MVRIKQKPPEKWGDWPYSKSKFALWLNKSREKSRLLGQLRVDCFHFAGFIANFMVLIVSIILLAIDISTKQALYKSLGELPTIIIMIGILLAPILYEVFLAVWWSLASRDSPKNLQIKKLKKIKKNNKKLKKKQN